MHRSTLIGVLLVIAACGEAPPEIPSGPSPLLTTDSDRLWILARAARIGDGKECQKFYLRPEDPRYQARAPKCDAWTRNYADYLRINGFPTIKSLHLQDPAYWQWYAAKRIAISQCWAAVGKLSVTATGADRADHTHRRNACDPYDNARHNDHLTPADLGIRFD